MKIAIVGPTYPYKGGIARHTTELAYSLSIAGNEVELVSWRAQWPFFYPGQQFVPGGQPEVTPFPATRRVLSWKNPISWWRWGRYLRNFDRVILVWWVPTIQGPVYLAILQALGKQRPIVTVICHNVLPHEAKPGDQRLAGMILRRADHLIVHSESQAVIAKQLTNKPISVIALPMSPNLLAGKTSRKPTIGQHLLFFGAIRRYKGLDVLLKALAKAPAAQLVIAGEFWGGSDKYVKLIDELGLQDRVTIDNRYLPDDELAASISRAAAVVLPYRGGTATLNARLAHGYGTPVIATTAATLATQVRDGIDGLLCQPDDVESLADALKRFYEPGMAAKLRSGVPKISSGDDWQKYVKAIVKS